MSFRNLINILLLCYILYAPIAHSKDVIRKSGDVGRYAVPGVAAGATLLGQDMEGFKQLLLSVIAVQLATEGLKLIIHEQRPIGHSNSSFPSGHTSAAFTGSAFLHERYGFKYSIPAYIYAGWTGYSRIHVKAHWPQDVVAGAILGSVITMLITEPYKKQDIEIVPEVGNEYVGLRFSKKW